MNYVTDTHSLVWYFTDDPRLSRKALKAFEGTAKDGRIIVPAVVMAEIMFISALITKDDRIKKSETVKTVW